MGDVNFKSTGKVEKVGSPTTRIGIELKSKIKQMSKEGRQVLVIKENENSSQDAIPHYHT